MEKDDVELCIKCPVARLRKRPFHQELKIFRPPERQHEALVSLVDEGQGIVSAAFAKEQTVAYAAFQLPDPFESWSQDPNQKIWELGAVEVAPAWRGQGLARRLLAETFATGFFEDKVVVAQLLSWHYDTERTGLSTFAYRELLIKLYRSLGFEIWRTSDPDIAGHIENALMARIGTKAAEETVKTFHRLRRQGHAPWDIAF